MVRLVFRPCTEMAPSICTSERLRASIAVSCDFTLPRHSSPSFGSQRWSSPAGARGTMANVVRVKVQVRKRTVPPGIRFLTRLRFLTQTLAPALDSLARVSRREDRKHFIGRWFGAGSTKEGNGEAAVPRHNTTTPQPSDAPRCSADPHTRVVE